MVDRKARYERKKRARERQFEGSRRARRGNMMRTVGIGIASLAVIAALGVGFVALVSGQKELPPTGFSPSHLEQYPPQQINLQPIPRLIQEHIMERGGSHPDGGMLIQYNCLDYECDPTLPDDLAAIVSEFPSQVYLAPYPGMDAKIALAAPGTLEILEQFDEGLIREFIRDHLDD